jgi:S1-C subfamily serine protease
MKNLVAIWLMVLCSVASAWGGGLETTLMAANRGHAIAQMRLGLMYLNGTDVPKDGERAVYWLTQSAKQGNAGAQMLIGSTCAEGQIVPQDYRKAAAWYKKAAEQGSMEAQYSLAGLYHEGQGVPHDLVLSHVWYTLAAASGHRSAIISRDLNAKELTPQQLVRARKLISQIQREIEPPTDSDQHRFLELKPDKRVVNSGTGSIITRNGYILTCYHIIRDAKSIVVTVGTTQHISQLVRTDPQHDLALLKIDGIFPAIAFSPKSSAEMGEEVFTIGFPNPTLQGVNAKFTNGTVNSLSGLKDDPRLYQISVPVQPGNSGGALFDDKGNIVGVIVSMLDAQTVFNKSGSYPQNVNYAIKSDYAKAMLRTVPGLADILLPASKTESNAVKRAKESAARVLSHK